MTRIHNIGHIHNTNFAQSQFSMSYPQKMHFLRNWEFTFFWKYLVCGFKIEISEYPTKVLYVTYSPYKYELHRTKTHEIRAKYFLPFFYSPHCSVFSSNFRAISFFNPLTHWVRCRIKTPPFHRHRNVQKRIRMSAFSKCNKFRIWYECIFEVRIFDNTVWPCHVIMTFVFYKSKSWKLRYWIPQLT